MDWISIPLWLAQGLAIRYPFKDNQLHDVDADQRAVWQIRTGGVLNLPDDVPSWEQSLRTLTPVPSISSVVMHLHSLFEGVPYVGVQVRLHAVSHERTREASPLEWFTNRMDSIRSDFHNVRFYVSCDVPQVQRELVERYPGSIALAEKGAYNSVLGVQSAIVDAYMLASSGYIVGPAYSSFVELAVRLSNHSVVFENSLKPAALDFDSLGIAADPLRPHVGRNRGMAGG